MGNKNTKSGLYILADNNSAGRHPRSYARGIQRGNDLCTRIDGNFLHIRSKRTKLVLSPEALGTAFLLPTVAMGRRLVGDSCDPVWLENTQRVLDQINKWWDYGAVQPDFTPGNPGRPSQGVGLAFSLGVDSFYSCFFADPAPDLLPG
jgi:hypothetical protein